MNASRKGGEKGMSNIKNFYDINELYDSVFQKKITKPHLYKLVARGDIPSRKFGARILIPAYWVRQITGDQIGDGGK